jgi:hypothetical protein
MFLLRDINPLSLKLLNRIYRKSRHHQVHKEHFLILVSQNNKNENLIKSLNLVIRLCITG